MRNIEAAKVTEVVRRLCIDANCYLPGDVKELIESFRRDETFPVDQGVLDQIIENYGLADQNDVPICQDTGLA